MNFKMGFETKTAFSENDDKPVRNEQTLKRRSWKTRGLPRPSTETGGCSMKCLGPELKWAAVLLLKEIENREHSDLKVKTTRQVFGGIVDEKWKLAR